MAEMVVAGQLPIDPEGSAHQASLVMVNIIDFHSLTAAMDPEDLVAFLNRHFDPLAGIVFRHDGMIAHYLGDRLLAAWGVPYPHDDHPLRAVTAAVEMQLMVEALNQAREKDAQPPIEIGIGITTGTVVAGMIGAQKTRRYTVIGEAVKEAQVICASARAEQILIGEATFKAVYKQFDIDEVHTLQLGDHSVKCFEILGEQDGRPQQPWSYLG
jgi:class 3 adenylate cyclase